MAGPWFTVQRSGEDWQVLDRIWISNKGENARGRVELKVEMLDPDLPRETPGSRHVRKEEDR